MADQKLTEIAVSNPVTTLADGDLVYVATIAAPAASGGITAENLALQVSDKLGLGSAAQSAATDFAPAAKGVTNGDSHNHSGGDGAEVVAVGVEFPNDGVGTQVNTLAEFYDRAWSATSVSGFGLTNNGDGTVTIAAGEVVVRSAASETAPLKLWSIAQTLNVALTNNSVNYIVANYNSGTPNVTAVTTTADFNCLDKCLLYKCVRFGTTIKWVDGRNMGVDSSRKHRRILMLTQGYRRAYGGVISEVGTRNIALTAGKFFWALSEDIDTSAFNSQTGDTFTAVYRDGAGGYTRAASQTQINNTQYDPGTGTLATLGNNKFGVHWIYLCFDTPTTVYSIYGTSEYATIAEAQASTVPSSLPPEIVELGELVGRIIIEKSASAFSVVESAFLTSFTATTPTSHNGLTGLQGGTTGEYYHPTAAEYARLQSLSTVWSETREPTGFVNDFVSQSLPNQYLTAPTVVNNAGTLTYTQGVSSGSIAYYWQSERKTVSSVSASATKAEGKWYVYTTDGTNFVLSQTAFNIKTDMSVGEFYWDNTNNVALWIQPEWHGCVMDAATHYAMHEAFGTRYVSGLALSGYTLNSASNASTRVKLTDGEIHDEDISAYIKHDASPNAIYEQILSGAGTADADFAALPIYYLSGATPVWRKQTATSYPFSPVSNTLMYYNRDNGGTWDYTTSASNLGYVVMWVVGTTNYSEPIVAIPGRADNATLTAAQAEAFPDISGLFTEYKLLYKLIYRTRSASSNNGKAELTEVVDYRRDAVGNNAAVVNATSAAMVTFTPAGNVAASNVQAAIEEIDTEKVALAGGTMTGDLVGHADTDYTTSRFRNVVLSTLDASGGGNGDIWIKYTA